MGFTFQHHKLRQVIRARATALVVAVLALIPTHHAHAEAGYVWINLSPAPTYALYELPSKTAVQFGDYRGKYNFFSWIEFDSAAKTVKYRNEPADGQPKVGFVECTGTYTVLPQKDFPNTSTFAVEFTLKDCNGEDMHGMVKLDGVKYPSLEFVPMCDTKNSPIGALTTQVAGLSTERDQLDELLTGFKNDLDRTKKELSNSQKSEDALNTENDKLKKTVSLQTGTINILNQKTTTLRKQNARYASQVGALQRQVTALQAQIAKMK